MTCLEKAAELIYGSAVCMRDVKLTKVICLIFWSEQIW